MDQASVHNALITKHHQPSLGGGGPEAGTHYQTWERGGVVSVGIAFARQETAAAARYG